MIPEEIFMVRYKIVMMHKSTFRVRIGYEK